MLAHLFPWLGIGHTLALLAAALVIYGFHPLQRWQYRHFPGPAPYWLLGNLPTIIRMGFPQAMQHWAGMYGGVFKIWQGGKVMVVIEDPASARRMNLKNHSRPPILGVFGGKEREWDNKGILFTEGGPYWQSLRQAWQAMFHPDSIREYMQLINRSSERLVGVLAEKAKTGEVVEVWRLMGCLTMEIVGAAGFGLNLRTLGPDATVISANAKDVDIDAALASADDPAADGENIQKAAAIIFGFSGARSSPAYVLVPLLFPELAPAVKWLAANLPDAALCTALKARILVRQICGRLIDDAQTQIDRQRAAETVNSEEPDGKAAYKNGALPAGSFLTHMLQAENPIIGRKFDQTEIVMQSFTFLLAGYETTSAALAFTVYHLAANPDKEAKLLAELDAFGRSRVPTYEDVSGDQLPYLDACLNESLRLSPPGALGTMRLVREDMTLCGYTIAKGSYCWTAQYSHQNNAAYWDDVKAFSPERFLGRDVNSMPEFAPFGEGGRSCVGKRLAKVEAKIALIRLYQRLTLRLEPGQVPLETVTNLTHGPKKGVFMTAHLRGP